MSDIHGNYEALKSVIYDLSNKKVDKLICLGDVVGYGPQPHKCIKVLRKLGVPTIRGNHDAAIIGETDWNLWRFEAQRTWQIAVETLSNEDFVWLHSLPLYYYENDFLCVHGSPKSPNLEYMYKDRKSVV
jgi:predicted phosphodiesterase